MKNVSKTTDFEGVLSECFEYMSLSIDLSFADHLSPAWKKQLKDLLNDDHLPAARKTEIREYIRTLLAEGK